MNQTDNNQIILKKIIDKRRAAAENELTESEFFEIYSASEILKDYDLSYDDLSYGVVGGPRDGGIDSIFTFLNGEYIKEDTDINSRQTKNSIELVIFQSKTSGGFSESTVKNFKESAEDLFDLSKDLTIFKKIYNDSLLAKAAKFREIVETLAGNFPDIHIRYFYVTMATDLHQNVKKRVEGLNSLINEMFSGCKFAFEFVGAKELLEKSRDVPASSRTLVLSESPTSTSDGSFLCLVALSDYYEFISDSGALVRSIFESNVRDYQGSIVVNAAIKKTLENQASDDFWHLNNGVTIITPRASIVARKLTIEDPQIVNGLQTSHEIYLHFSGMANPSRDDRAVLVRVICEENEDARDRIIRATNSQTSIPAASLRSSDVIHRNIEDFLKTNGFFYDRKKNRYKNEGKPVSKVISIPYLAQAMMSTILLRPDSARARPSTIINSDVEYKKIFSLDIPIDVYLKVIQIMKTTERYLKPDKCGRVLEKKVITNIRFHVAMIVSINLLQATTEMVGKLSSLDSIAIPDDVLERSLNIVLSTYDDLGGTDQIAKGSVLVSKLIWQCRVGDKTPNSN